MANISANGISKSFGKTKALSDVRFDVKEGTFTVLLGPSGSGKTTLLNIIAGFESPDTGNIFIDGESAMNIPPNKRDIGMVFQKHSLYPDKSVRKNLSFSLDIRPSSSGEFETGNKDAIIKQRVEEIARLLHIQELLDRMPHELSGGQMQRVAIGKALIRKSSKMLLMDEPFSNLDPMLRIQLRRDLKSIARERNLTVIFVTHDQSEAEELADEIIMFRDGKVMQTGSPQRLYDHPNNLFVASFFGVPTINILPAFARKDLTKVSLQQDAVCNQSIKLGIRPNKVNFSPTTQPHFSIPFTFKTEKFYNGYHLMEGKVNGTDFVVVSDRQENSEEKPGLLYINHKNCQFFDSLTGDNVR